MSLTEKQLSEVNQRAEFLPQIADDPYSKPCIAIGGVHVFAYVDERGDLVVSVLCEDAADWVFGDECVPMRINVGSWAVYQADRDGSEDMGQEQHSTDGRPTVIVRPGQPVLVFGDVDVLTTPAGAREYLSELEEVPAP